MTVIEVLDEEHFNKVHLPGAFNVPLSGDFELEIQDVVPDKTTPFAVCRMDADCDASLEATQRMEDLGYERVHYYEGGKTDWEEAGLPTES